MTETDLAPPAAPGHPEEYRASFDLRFGRSLTLKGTARCTPAGVVSAGIATAAILLSVAVLVKAVRQR